MSDKFDRIKNMYEESFKLHGDSSKALMTPKGRQELRFRVLDDFVSSGQKSLLDYGCGLGYLYEYFLNQQFEVEYTGQDITPSFIEACKNKFDNSPDFKLIQAKQKLKGKFDIVYSSGVFNIRLEEDEIKSKNIVYARLEELFSIAEEVLVCDFLSPFVDFQQEDSLHFGIGEIADFCSNKLSRRFQIRHDLLPYELTLIAYKDDEIHRPGNFFAIDNKLETETKK